MEIPKPAWCLFQYTVEAEASVHSPCLPIPEVPPPTCADTEQAQRTATFITTQQSRKRRRHWLAVPPPLVYSLSKVSIPLYVRMNILWANILSMATEC